MNIKVLNKKYLHKKCSDITHLVLSHAGHISTAQQPPVADGYLQDNAENISSVAELVCKNGRN